MCPINLVKNRDSGSDYVRLCKAIGFTHYSLILSPPLNTYSGSNIRLTLMLRFTLLKARNESLSLSTSSELVLTRLSATLIVQVVRKLEASTCSDWLEMG